MPNRIKVNKGDRYGRLTIITEVEKRKKKRYFLCKCDCGSEKIVRFVAMRAEEIKSCGCLRDEQNRVSNIQHGKWGTALYSSWHCMKQRCINQQSAAYHYYGGRGIKVCDNWLDFKNFYKWAMSSTYKKGLTIERIDVNGNYEPNNCTWISKHRQQNNTRRSMRIKFNNKTMILKDWANELGFEYPVLQYRIYKGWDVKKAFTTPVMLNYSRRKHEI